MSIILFNPAEILSIPSLKGALALPSEYPTIITLTIRDDEVAVRFKREESDEQPDKNQQYEPLLLSPDDLDIKLLDLCRRLIQDDRIQSRPDFLVIGRLLHKALFTKKVKEYFEIVRDTAKPTSEKRLRVELEFKGKDGLGLFKLPWEYICYEAKANEWEFVSTVAELVLTRYLQPRANSPQLVVELDNKKIDVLLVVLNPEPGPDGLGDLSAVEKDVKTELEGFKQSLSGHNVEVVIHHPVDRPMTWERFVELIKAPDCRPHILHLIAHGQFDEYDKVRSGKIAFHLHDRPEEIEAGIEGGNIDWKNDKTFVDLFVEANKLPRFAFLHMCEGGAIDKQDTSAGVALRLAQEGVPAVVAMQHPIEINTSTVFSKVFYEMLGAGQTVDEAVQLGRARIAAQDADNRAFGTPVLYLSTRSEAILPKIRKPAGEAQDRSPQVIDLVAYQDQLMPIFRKYINDGTLTADNMKQLEGQLRQLIGALSDRWVQELESEYKKYNPFLPIEEKLMDLCRDLVNKIRELARRS